MPENNISLAGIASALASAKNVLILTHERPDGDTVGCAFALKYAYSDGDRRVEVACCDAVRTTLTFITGSEALPVPDGFEPDLVCAVDAASTGMLGSLYEKYSARIGIKIDHHRTSEPYARFNYVDDGAAACGEIIYRMLAEAGRLTAPVCGALYAAVASDTGCFRFGNTTADSLRIAAALIDGGADHRYINRMLFERRTAGEIAAQKLALSGLRYRAGGRIAVIGFTNDMKREFGFTEDDVSPLHNLPREIIGVEIGITVRQSEADPGEYRISLRSSGETDCSAVCAVFGGGGHRGAAGCQVRASSLDEAEDAVVAEAEKFLK